MVYNARGSPTLDRLLHLSSTSTSVYSENSQWYQDEYQGAYYTFFIVAAVTNDGHHCQYTTTLIFKQPQASRHHVLSIEGG